MNPPSRLPARQAVFRWSATAITALCWALALAVRYSSFSIAGRADKAAILTLLLIPTGFLAAWIYHDLLPHLFGPLYLHTLLKPAVLGTLAAALFLLLTYSSPPFPEHHLLEITPYPPDGNGTLEVISVQRIELPGGERRVVPPGKMEQQGNWQKAADSDALSIPASADAKLSYARLMQAGIEIVFRTGPDQCGAHVRWDGQDFVLHLNTPTTGQQVLLLQPALDWQHADLNRKILLGTVLLAEFFSLTVTFSLTGTLLYQAAFGKKIQLRAAKPVLLGILTLALLLAAVNHINPPASFQDAALEAAVREALNEPTGPLYQNTLRTIAELDASHHNITSLSGIQQLRNLTSLNLRGNLIVDLSPLTSLKRLQILNLRDNPLEDISPLAHLTHLQYLNLHSDYRVRSLEPLRKLDSLRTLILAHVPVGDQVGILTNFNELRYLNLRNSGITDLSPLAELTHLEYLNLHSNHRIRTLAPLQNMGNLETLILAHVPVGDQIDLLQGMAHLTRLNLRDCGISDLSVIGQLMAGGALQDNLSTDRNATLDLRDNPLLTPLPDSDPYAVIRPYWENIFHRLPFDLPPARIQPPEFSRLGGFYPAAFNLELIPANPGDVVYYTLDGSEPDIQNNPDSTHQYKAPILITRHTGYRMPVNPDERARLSDVLYYGAQVVRAVSVNQEKLASEVVTYTYIIDENLPQNYRLPVISITTDPQNLYDYTEGVYIKGRVYDEWQGYFKERYPRSQDYNSPANYHQRGHTYLSISGIEAQEFIDNQVAIPLPDHGLDLDFNYWRTVPLITISGTEFYDGRYYLSPDSDEDTLVIQKTYVPEIFPAGAQIIQDWEKPVHMEFFESDGSLAFSQDLGMRIHGGASRASSQKSLRFYARADYSREDLVRYRLFPDEDTGEFQRFILRTTMQRSGLNDIIGQLLMRAAHPEMDIQRYRPVMVFLNGDFWGWYNLRDRYDDRYLAFKYGVDRQDIAYLEELAVLRYGQPQDADDFMELDAFIRSADLRDDANFSRVADQMDVENYTDYILTGTFLDYRDWGPKHDQKWRYRGDNPPPGAPAALDGRWRWLPIDMDLSMIRSADSDYLEIMATTSGNYLPYFLVNESYHTYFINRFADLLNTAFREEASVALLEDVVVELPEMLIEENIKRWRNTSSLQDWMADVDRIRTFLRERPQYMRAEAVEFFNLEGTATLTLETDSTRGTIQVNTITITPETPGIDENGRWSGIYFKGVPLQISAIPHPGHQFIGWEGEGINLNEADLTLTLSDDVTLRAIFVPSS